MELVHVCNFGLKKEHWLYKQLASHFLLIDYSLQVVKTQINTSYFSAAKEELQTLRYHGDDSFVV